MESNRQKLPFSHSGHFYFPTSETASFPNTPTLRKWNCFALTPQDKSLRLIRSKFLPVSVGQQDILLEFEIDLPIPVED